MNGVFAVVVVVVLLANELEFVQDVQLLAGGQLLVAHHTSETVEVEHFALGLADKITGQNPLGATSTLGPKSPVAGKKTVELFMCDI